MGPITDFTTKTEKNFCVTLFYLLLVLGTETIFPTNTGVGKVGEQDAAKVNSIKIHLN